MNPDTSNQYDQVTLENIDPHPFELIYDKTTYGIIEPGQLRTFPKFLADHALKHLIDQCCNTNNISTSNQEARQKFAAKIIKSIQPVVIAPQKTASQKLQEEVDAMNRPSDLELLMAKSRSNGSGDVQVPFSPQGSFNVTPAPTLSDVLPSTPKPPTGYGAFAAGQPTDAVLPSTDAVDNTVPANGTFDSGKKENPTRQDLLDFAQNRLKMNINAPEISEKFATMSDAEIRQAISYDIM